MMSSPIHPYARTENLEKLSNTSNSRQFNNNSISTSQNHVTPPAVRIIVKNNELKLYTFIQQGEYQYRNLKNNSDEDSSSIVEPSSYSVSEDSSSIVEPSSYSIEEDSSSIVEPSSYSDEEKYYAFFQPTTEPILTSRPSAVQKKNLAVPYEEPSIHFFKNMPEDVTRKVLFDHIIDLNDIPTTAKNLMAFAGASKFNQEFVRQLLNEEEFHEVLFEITKSFIPNLLSSLANDINAEFTQSDIDHLVHNYPYLTCDSSYEKNRKHFTEKGIKALKQIVRHPDLKGLRIINNLPEDVLEWEDAYQACNKNGLELIESLLSRENSNPIKVDFEFKNWMPPLDSEYKIKEEIFDRILEIQKKGKWYSGVTFGEINLSRSHRIGECYHFERINSISSQSIEYQFMFVTMMCNIGITHSAHTISIAGLKISQYHLDFIIDVIRKCDKQNLKHLDLSRNNIVRAPAKALKRLLESENICLKTLKLNDSNMNEDALHFISKALANNTSLELIEMPNHHLLSKYGTIKNDKRVKITEAESIW